MAQTYSRRLLGGVCPNGGAITAVVPGGVIWVVRSITCNPLATGTSYWHIVIEGIGTIFGGGSLALGSPVYWNGRQVLNQTETLAASVLGADLEVLVSGYELVAP